MRIEKKGMWWVDGKGNTYASREQAISMLFEEVELSWWLRNRPPTPLILPSMGNEFDPQLGEWRY